jgi:hypothetical protein
MTWLHVVSSVRCLACGTVYPKPASIGMAESNPGCPRCSYVGWAPADADEDDEVMEGPAPLRSVADRPRLRFWQAG